MNFRSLVDPKLQIQPRNWVVSIVRKREGRGVNPQHGFLILEGMADNGKYVIHRFDLFKYTYDPHDPNRNNKQKEEDQHAFIKTTKLEIPEDKKLQEYNELIFQTPEEVRNGLYAKSWNISKDQAEELICNIEQDKTKAIYYNISGAENVTGNLSMASNTGSSIKGHNCFTWAPRETEGTT